MFGWFKSRRQREQEFFENMIRAGLAAKAQEAAGQRLMARAVVERALKSLGGDVAPESDIDQFCIQACSEISRRIFSLSESLKDDGEGGGDDLGTGIFCFILCNHVTQLVGANFEVVSAIAAIDVIKSPEELDTIIDLYNDHPKISNLVGPRIAEWISEPSRENLLPVLACFRLLTREGDD